MLVPESLGEDPRGKYRNDAEKIGRTDPYGDQREHVQVARHQRVIAASQERPACPENHRRSQAEFNPEGRALAKHVSQEAEPDQRSHRQDEQRNRQCRPNPETALEVDQFRIRAFVTRGHALRLERHAAEGAAARSHLFDFGVHRARKDRPCGSFLGHAPVRAGEIMLRIGRELVVAALAAEVE